MSTAARQISAARISLADGEVRDEERQLVRPAGRRQDRVKVTTFVQTVESAFEFHEGNAVLLEGVLWTGEGWFGAEVVQREDDHNPLERANNRISDEIGSPP